MHKKFIVSSLLALAVLAGVFFVSTSVYASACVNLTSNIALSSLDSNYPTPDVTTLQTFLVSKSLLTATPNGIFGPKTQTAVKAFQGANGLEATGYVGTSTRGKIKDISCGTSSASTVVTPDSNVSIRDFVSLLVTIGVIPPEKIPAINIFLANLKLAPLTLSATSTIPVATTTATTTVPAVVHVSSGGGGGGGGGSAPVTYTVTYNANGAATGTVPVDSGNYSSGSTVTAKENSGALTRTSYGFIGWNTAADGSGSNWVPDSPYSIGSASVTLYAQWATVFHGGDGSVGNPFQISSWSELSQIRDNMSANYILIANLSSTTPGYTGLGSSDWLPFTPGPIGLGSNWMPLGATYYDNDPVIFTGNFDGNNKTISDLVIDLQNEHVGLFAIVTGNISNLGVLNISALDDSDSTGAIVGMQAGGTISNCYSTGNIGGLAYLGGLVGKQATGTISRSYSKVNVTQNAGSRSPYFGGLVGAQSGPATLISDSYSMGSVYGPLAEAGGFIGSAKGLISNSYSVGTVPHSLGSCFTGDYKPTLISNSYCDIETSGVSVENGGTGTTTAAMKKIATYQGWDIAPTGVDLNNGYPYLAWQAGNNSPTWNIYVPTYTVTYDANSATGTVPVDTTRYAADTAVNILDANTLSKPGYAFTGWNTAADGNGYAYATSTPATIFVYETNVTLYAQWSPTYAVTFVSGAFTPEITGAQNPADGTISLKFKLVNSGSENIHINETGSNLGYSLMGASTTAAIVTSLDSEKVGGVFTTLAGDESDYTLTLKFRGTSGFVRLALNEVDGLPVTGVQTSAY